jgi:peroxiredoxin
MTELGELAKDFNLIDTQGRDIHLSDFRNKKNILLVLVRGFA